MSLRKRHRLFGDDCQSVRPRRRDARFRPQQEPLEARALLATFFVDDDGQQRPDANFQTINAAVAAASPGDTIRVYPGLYEESVAVDKQLTFKGAFAGDQPEERGTKAPNPNTDSIVKPSFGSGFEVAADRVQIDGFTLMGATTQLVNDYLIVGAGISTSSAYSGYQIRNNIIRDNSRGLDMGSSGAIRSYVEQNFFLANNAEGVPGIGGSLNKDGYGVLGVGIHNVLFDDNFFTGHDTASMYFVQLHDFDANSGLTIQQNELRDDAPLVLEHTHDSVIDDNTIVRPNGDGIHLHAGSKNIRVTNNELRDGVGHGIHLGFFNESDVGGVTNNLIENNRISGFGGDGIRLGLGSHFNLVRLNETEDNDGNGINLEELASNNRIVRNQSNDNELNGIRADSTTSENEIWDNEMEDNEEYDAYDDSVGGGTAGTANFWRSNDFETRNRRGLR